MVSEQSVKIFSRCGRKAFFVKAEKASPMITAIVAEHLQKGSTMIWNHRAPGKPHPRAMPLFTFGEEQRIAYAVPAG